MFLKFLELPLQLVAQIPAGPYPSYVAISMTGLSGAGSKYDFQCLSKSGDIVLRSASFGRIRIPACRPLKKHAMVRANPQYRWISLLVCKQAFSAFSGELLCQFFYVLVDLDSVQRKRNSILPLSVSSDARKAKSTVFMSSEAKNEGKMQW